MRRLSSVLLLFLITGLAPAADWPQWLGHNRDSSSSETVAAWRQPPRVLWKVPVGEGHSSPIVSGDRVFLHAKPADKEEEEVTAWDAATGKPIWKTSYPRSVFRNIFGNGPRATPAVHGDRLFSFGVTGLLTCFDVATGKQVWQVDTLKKFSAPNLFFGASSSPLIEGNGVLVNVGAKGASVVAFDQNSGETIWQSQDDRASYSSPIAIDQNGRRQVIFLTQKAVISLSPADGRLFWKFPLVDLLSESSSTPLCAGNVLLASSITYGSAGLALKTADGRPSFQELWKNSDLTCYFSSPVAVGNDNLYVVTGTKPPAFRVQAILRCVEAKTGKERWQRPKVGKYHASLLRTGNDKLLLLEDSGDLVLLDPNPQEYRELARSHICGDTWAHLALANGRLYVRDNKDLICLELSK
jgi:outer membrane protein assembly factor BamB